MTTTDGFETQSAPPAAPEPPAPKRTVGVRLDSGEAFAGIAGGFAFTAVTNAIAIAAGTPGSATLAERLAHHAFDAAETLGIGVLAGALVELWLRLVRAPPSTDSIKPLVPKTRRVSLPCGSVVPGGLR